MPMLIVNRNEPSIQVPTDGHPFPLQIARTALIVVDMQNAFCHPEGFCGNELGADLTAARAIIPRLQRVISWARQQQLSIVYTRESHLPDLSDLKPSKALRYANAGYPVGGVRKMGRFLIRGELGTELIAELQPTPDELQIGVFCIDPRKGGFWKIRFSITPLKSLPVNKRLSQKLHFLRHADIMSLSMSQNVILRSSKE